MVFHGLPIKHGDFPWRNNQMVHQDEIHGMVRGSDPRQNIQNANLERALTALTNKMGTLGCHFFDRNARVLLGEITDITSAFPDFEAAGGAWFCQKFAVQKCNKSYPTILSGPPGFRAPTQDCMRECPRAEVVDFSREG